MTMTSVEDEEKEFEEVCRREESLREKRGVSQDMIDNVRSLLTDSENEMADDDMVARYLNAVNRKDERKAAKRLKATLEWWEKENPASMVCSACSGDCAEHYMHCVCYDIRGRPTIYSCLELAINKDIEDNRIHMVSTFETAVSLMDASKGVISWNWVLDMHGFALVDCDPRLAKIFLQIAADHYPERLGNFFIVDAPRLFSSLWSAISRFVDPKTKKKIQFLKVKDANKMRASFGDHFDDETVEWLVNEIKENRVKKKGEKSYNYKELAMAVTSSDNNVDSNGHHHLCTPTFLDDVRNLPNGVPERLYSLYSS